MTTTEGDVGVTARFSGSLSLLVPEGSAVRESLELTCDAGISLNVISEPIPDTTSIEAYARAYGEKLAGELPGYVEARSESAAVFNGRAGWIREFAWGSDDSERVTQVQAYAIEAGRGYVATATCQARSYVDLARMMTALISTADIRPSSYGLEQPSDWSQPRAAALSFEWGATETVSVPDSSSDPLDWSQAREQWRSGSVEPPNGHSVPLSTDELTVLAQHFGHDAFPGVATDSFTGYSFETQLIAGRAARRGLLSRGIVAIDDEGAVEINPEYSTLIQDSLTAGLMASLERTTHEGTSNRQFLVHPDRMVIDTMREDGTHVLALASTGRLLDEILGEGPDTVLDGRPEETLKVPDLREVFDPEGPMAGHPLTLTPREDRAMKLFTCTYVANGNIEGSWLAWFETPVGKWLIEDPGANGASTLRSIDCEELERRILSYLPQS